MIIGMVIYRNNVNFRRNKYLEEDQANKKAKEN
jgi:hypothetical protein